MESRGLRKALPKLLKSGVALALSCAALAHSPQSAQAQSTKAPAKAPVLQFGVPLVGPAPMGAAPAPDICWAPGTSAATIAAFERRRIDKGFAPLTSLSPYRTIGQGRWTRTATDGGGLIQGQPTTIRYSIVPDGTPIDGFAGEPESPSNLQVRLNQIYGNKATWLALFARVGQALSAQSGLTYVYEPNDDGALFGPDANGERSPGQIGVRGDVRVSGHPIDGPGPGTLAYNYEPAGGGDMVIDTADDFYEDRQQNDLGFRNVITHEFGHGVGLGHTCPINETKLMEPFVSYNFDGPQFDDIRGLQRFYGDDLEDNDTAATGNDLGTLGDGTVTVAQDRILSIDDARDVDFFRFSAAANKSIGITMAPTGDVYQEGPQNADGSCGPGTRLDPKVINNLGFELLQADATGAFVPVATVDSSPIGGTETLAPTNYPDGGQFRIRVFGADVKDVQTYSLQIVVGPPVVEPTPVPTPTVGPTPTPVPTGVPTPTPIPAPTPIRPIVDLNGLNADEATGEDSATPSGIDNTSDYFYQRNNTVDENGVVVDRQPGGVQIISPQETIVLSDISAQPVIPGKAITEARVELTPDNNFGGTAPDNLGTKGDQEVLGIPAAVLKRINDRGGNLSANYNLTTQILTIKGGTGNLDFNRGNYEEALRNVTYENKRAFPQLFDTDGLRNRIDRVITFVVDTDNDDSNNQDSRFAPQDPGNPKQSRPAVLNLRFVEAPSLIVTTTADGSTSTFNRDYNDGRTTLREAITFANSIEGFTFPDPANPPVITPPSVITFAQGVGGTINLTSPLPAIDAQTDVTIQGPGARQLTINGAGTGSGIFRANSNATFNGLAITGGTAAVDATGTAAFGGGIFGANGSDVAVDSCAIFGNSAQFGGGIATVGSSLALTNSLVSGNSATTGGGVFVNLSFGFGGASNTRIFNSTISGNSGSGVTQRSGSATITSATITNNSVGYDVTNSASANVNNTIISGNASDNDVARNGGNFTSGGYNIIGAGTGAVRFTVASNDRTGITGNTAGLSALGNNGGKTDTHALFTGSPAIDGGDPAYPNPAPVPPTPENPGTPGPTDQRGEGFPRVVNPRGDGGPARVDVGAFEKQDSTPIVGPVITPRNPTTNQTLTANANSDTTNLTYEWQRNGFTVKGPSTSNTLDLSVPGNGNRGDVITVIVRATNASGTTIGRDSVTVANTAPTLAPTITATNPAPNSGSQEVLTNSVLTANPNAADVDPGDIANFTYQWKVNGQIRPAETGKTIDLSKPGNGDRGDTVSVDVTVSDVNFNGQGSSVTRTATTVVGNTAPIAQNVTFNVTPGQTVRILLAATDVDTKAPTQANPAGVDNFFKFTIVTNPTKGTAKVEYPDNRGVLVYTANANATGSDSFTFTATDTTTVQDLNTATAGQGAKTSAPATATARFTGTPPNPTPTPTPGPNPTPTPTPGPTPTPNPTPAPNPTPTPDPNRAPAGASFSVNLQREVPIVANIALSDPDFGDTYDTLRVVRINGLKKGVGSIRKDTDGIWKLFYKASRLYKGNDQAQYVVIDSKGAQSAPATITLNIFNTKPTARSTKLQVLAGGSGSIPLFGQDLDNDPITFKRVGGPNKGNGEIRKDEFGIVRFYYQNSPLAIGDDLVSFVSQDGNPGGDSEIATIEIDVVGIFNRRPTAQNVSGTTTTGKQIAIPLVGTDPDEGDVLTFKRVSGAKNGFAEIMRDTDGTFKLVYTSLKNFTGTEVIRYVALDSKGKDSPPANITITVTAPTTPSAGSAIQSNPNPSAGSS